MIDQEDILDYLNKQFNFLNHIYNKEHLLGIFVLGKANYGFAETLEDIETLVIYLPSLEEICCSAPFERDIPYGMGKTVHLVDLRKILDWAFDQNGDLMEALFTDYYILNPKYENLFIQQFVRYRELIFRYNEQKRIEFAVSRAIAALDDYEETKNVDQLFEGYRLYLAASLYVEGINIKDCINIRNDLYREYLEGILNGKIKPNIKITKDRLKVISSKALYLAGNPEAKELIQAAIAAIIKISLTSAFSAEELYQSLTTNEQEAYKIIVSHLENGEGEISISQLLQETTLSRPVFKSTLQKLETYGIAEVAGRGTKGTHIKFIDKSYLFDNN